VIRNNKLGNIYNGNNYFFLSCQRGVFILILLSTTLLKCKEKPKVKLEFDKEILSDCRVRKIETYTFHQSVFVEKKSEVSGRNPIFSQILFFDNDENIEREITIDGNDSILSEYQYTNNKNFFKIFRYKKKALESQSTVMLDKSGRDKKYSYDFKTEYQIEIEKNYFKDSIVTKETHNGHLISTTVENLNSNGLPDKIIFSFYGPDGSREVTSIDTLIYLEFDKKGNWIKRLKNSKMDPTERGRIQLRKIEYKEK